MIQNILQKNWATEELTKKYEFLEEFYVESRFLTFRPMYIFINLNSNNPSKIDFYFTYVLHFEELAPNQSCMIDISNYTIPSAVGQQYL